MHREALTDHLISCILFYWSSPNSICTWDDPICPNISSLNLTLTSSDLTSALNHSLQQHLCLHHYTLILFLQPLQFSSKKHFEPLSASANYSISTKYISTLLCPEVWILDLSDCSLSVWALNLWLSRSPLLLSSRGTPSGQKLIRDESDSWERLTEVKMHAGEIQPGLHTSETMYTEERRISLELQSYSWHGSQLTVQQPWMFNTYSTFCIPVQLLLIE